MHIQLPLQDTAPEPLLAQNAIHLHHNHPFHESCNSTHNWQFSICALGTHCLSSPSYISSPPASPSPSDTSTSEFDASISCLDSEQDYLSYTPKHNRMPKRRTSLQSILIPPFLSSPLSSTSESSRSSTRVRSPSTSSHPPPHGPPSSVHPPEAASLESSRISPPPDFLLDDDPFANYSGARPLPSYHGNSTSAHSRRTSIRQPRSPLATEPCPSPSPFHSSSSPVPIPCSRSASSPSRISPPTPPVSGRQLRPAYTRPAFAPRPSLPSLHTLAQSDFVYPIKVRNIFSSQSSR
ncbi:hypothetical protein BJV74DRAFT_382521 [Russula compacta]|nr:hypothetical protein BJV74DRAFT_382521 [Russula compacta]